MSIQLTRQIIIDGWIFEVKAMRALKVERYGEPYKAIANINLNGDSAFIDGLMTKGEEDFEQADYQKLIAACKQLAVEEVNFGEDMFTSDSQPLVLNQA
tara:strand:- start:116 stop:412 length:297 start_codon:yes stop_codon:yes gene_type:complete